MDSSSLSVTITAPIPECLVYISQTSLLRGIEDSSGLAVRWCTYDDAKRAVMSWHYSRKMPTGRLFKFGVYEDDRFVGAVIFGHSPTPNLGRRFGLTHRSVLELTRVALKSRKSPTSQIVARAVKMLREEHPQLELLVSYADPEQNHVGTIYQAMNWRYDGLTEGGYVYRIDEDILHARTMLHRYGTRAGYIGQKEWKSGKHRYYLPLSRRMKSLIKQTLPYPKQEPLWTRPPSP